MSIEYKDRFFSINKFFYSMKHRFLFTLCFCAMSGLSAYAQKVTIHFQKVKLEKVFGEITRQTGLTVAYSQPTVNPKRIVSVNANKEELNVVLTRLFAAPASFMK